jgi:5-methylthioadenosine/S-adenosylhomocysteine deaminase
MFTATTEDVFTAATIGSAKALLRKDLGRLAVGMKADIVLVDMETPPGVMGFGRGVLFIQEQWQ